MTAAADKRPVMVPITYGDRVLGFLFRRGPRGFEVFDIDEHSLGTFADERTAVAALFNRKPARRAP